MAFQYQKLKAKIVEKYGNQGNFAKELGISEVSVSRKMNGTVSFSRNDILKWCEKLDIEQNDIGLYFFA